MAPPDGNRAPRIPTLSWSSVIDSTDHDAPDAAVSAPDVSPSASPTVPVVPPPAPLPPVIVAPAPPVIVAPAPPVTSVPPADAVAAPVADDHPTVRTAPPGVIVPVLGDVTSGPELLDPASATTVLPEIREATPVEAIDPVLPSVTLPASKPSEASPFEFDPASVVAPSTTQPRLRKKRGGTKLVVALVVLGGLAAAGVVFGQPYLFPGDWDDATAPYADAVESVRGVDFVEPLSIIAEPTTQFAGRLQAQLAPTSPGELAEWRALALVTGVVDDATLAQQLADWQDSLYSTEDGQVYRDLGAAGAELDAELVQTMAAASFDQEFRWSTDQDRRTLDAAAATSAEVIGQAREVQAGSEFDGEVAPVPTTRLGALPSVIGYRLLAPHVFADFTSQQTPNPLLGLGPLGPGPLGDEVPRVAAPPSMLEGDVIVDSPTAKDRSFWFLVFGGILDGPTAFSASEAIVENSLTHAVRGTTSCVYATFSGGGVEQTDTLRSALFAWSAAAPTEFASSLTALPDGSLQLASCDPGDGFGGSIRSGAATELVAWRAVELATYEAVTAGGGDDAEFANAWGLIGASDAPLEVAALPAGTSPSDIARAARDAVAALYGPAS